jgi:indole-3-glycerol phosphate synthase
MENYLPDEIAPIYEHSGASAISVLTEEKYFQGKLEHLHKAKTKSSIPILRKDFILEEIQLLESRAVGADAVLLIARILDDEKLRNLYEKTYELGMQALVEVHNAEELERALELNANIIGINNRDLDTLKTDLETTIDLMDDYPELESRVVVSESGIEDYEQIEMLQDKGVRAVLVGESILKTQPLGRKIEELLGKNRR